MSRMDQKILMKALEWSYEKVLVGSGPFDSAYKLAEDHLNKAGNKETAVENLVNWQVAKCATSGFVTGLGGLITLPVAIPANLSSVLLMQIRMVVSIALIGGFDPKDESVKSLVFACLTGTAASGIFREIGVKLGAVETRQVMQKINSRVISRINYLVKVRMLTKTGRIGLLNFGKIVPLIGGVVGGALDASSTRSIAKAAKQLFILPNRS